MTGVSVCASKQRISLFNAALQHLPWRLRRPGRSPENRASSNAMHLCVSHILRMGLSQIPVAPSVIAVCFHVEWVIGDRSYSPSCISVTPHDAFACVPRYGMSMAWHFSRISYEKRFSRSPLAATAAGPQCFARLHKPLRKVHRRDVIPGPLAEQLHG